MDPVLTSQGLVCTSVRGAGMGLVLPALRLERGPVRVLVLSLGWVGGTSCSSGPTTRGLGVFVVDLYPWLPVGLTHVADR